MAGTGAHIRNRNLEGGSQDKKAVEGWFQILEAVLWANGQRESPRGILDSLELCLGGERGDRDPEGGGGISAY